LQGRRCPVIRRGRDFLGFHRHASTQDGCREGSASVRCQSSVVSCRRQGAPDYGVRSAALLILLLGSVLEDPGCEKNPAPPADPRRDWQPLRTTLWLADTRSTISASTLTTLGFLRLKESSERGAGGSRLRVAIPGRAGRRLRKHLPWRCTTIFPNSL
jgi:hypothetical protein